MENPEIRIISYDWVVFKQRFKGFRAEYGIKAAEIQIIAAGYPTAN